MLRRRQARSVLRRRGALPAADGERWAVLCRAAVSGRGAAVGALLDALREAAERGTAEDRKAAVEELLRAAPRLWILLDRCARLGPRRPPGWRAPAAEALPRDADPLGLVLASFDGDGRVRQAAVERLARRSGRYAVTALALRTDDWVPRVRETALAALLTHVAPDEAAAAVRVLARLAGRRRAGAALERYRVVLGEPDRRRAVRRLAAEPDPPARRFGMRLALDLGEYVRGDLARTTLGDRDPVCRLLCARRLLELDPDQAGRLLWARSAAVRELAVAALPDDVPAARLVAPLADRSRMVRAQARWKLYRRGEPPVEVYRRQLRRCGRTTQARLLAGLAAGLGECGDASDLPMLTVLAGDPSWPAVARRAAVRAIGRLCAASPGAGRPPHGGRSGAGSPGASGPPRGGPSDAGSPGAASPPHPCRPGAPAGTPDPAGAGRAALGAAAPESLASDSAVPDSAVPGFAAPHAPAPHSPAPEARSRGAGVPGGGTGGGGAGRSRGDPGPPDGRAQAVRVLGRLAAEPAAGIARDAVDALAAGGDVGLPVLAAAVGRPEPQVWRAALRAARRLPSADRLELMLRAAADPRPEVARHGRAGVAEWRRAAPAAEPLDGSRRRGLAALLWRARLTEPERAAVAAALRTSQQVG